MHRSSLDESTSTGTTRLPSSCNVTAAAVLLFQTSAHIHIVAVSTAWERAANCGHGLNPSRVIFSVIDLECSAEGAARPGMEPKLNTANKLRLPLSSRRAINAALALLPPSTGKKPREAALTSSNMAETAAPPSVPSVPSTSPTSRAAQSPRRRSRMGSRKRPESAAAL